MAHSPLAGIFTTKLSSTARGPDRPGVMKRWMHVKGRANLSLDAKGKGHFHRNHNESISGLLDAQERMPCSYPKAVRVNDAPAWLASCSVLSG